MMAAPGSSQLPPPLGQQPPSPLAQAWRGVSGHFSRIICISITVADLLCTRGGGNAFEGLFWHLALITGQIKAWRASNTWAFFFLRGHLLQGKRTKYYPIHTPLCDGFSLDMILGGLHAGFLNACRVLTVKSDQSCSCEQCFKLWFYSTVTSFLDLPNFVCPTCHLPNLFCFFPPRFGSLIPVSMNECVTLDDQKHNIWFVGSSSCLWLQHFERQPHGGRSSCVSSCFSKHCCFSISHSYTTIIMMANNDRSRGHDMCLNIQKKNNQALLYMARTWLLYIYSINYPFPLGASPTYTCIAHFLCCLFVTQVASFTTSCFHTVWL